MATCPRGPSGEEPPGPGEPGQGQAPGKRPGQRQRCYRRHPKAPYSFVAMIALVIQASPEKRLTLRQPHGGPRVLSSRTLAPRRPHGAAGSGPAVSPQIHERVAATFPSFAPGYSGWKDSIRHSLSASACFRKLLKDPAKPRAKGNQWVLDASRLRPGELRRQNTAVARRDASFARDLSPYVLHGLRYQPRGGRPEPPPSRFSSSFCIEALLGDAPRGEPAAGVPACPPSTQLPAPPGFLPWGWDVGGPCLPPSPH
ncbi:forkhead box protein H1-like [Struthio camelus]|uniref:forkhead box protein H1-like n=1 Tax=Struthio camelus TaxID=8801 RepID=UPI00360416FD